MNNNTAAAKSKKSTWSPVDAWGTPEHDAAVAQMRKGHECRDVVAGRKCTHVISDKRYAAIRKTWY